MTDFERPGFNHNSALTGEPTVPTNPWEVTPDQLPTTFAMAGGPKEVLDYYDEANQRAAAKEVANKTVNEKPALADMTEDEITSGKHHGLDLIAQGRERLNHIVEGIGKAGLRFA